MKCRAAIHPNSWFGGTESATFATKILQILLMGKDRQPPDFISEKYFMDRQNS